MSDPHVDTDIIIRLLTSDDPLKQQAARRLFLHVQGGTLILRGPDTVIADAVYVLSSRTLYRKSRAEVAALLTPLLRLPNFKLQNKRTVTRALSIYAQRNLDFGDAMLIASMERTKATALYSYDHDFDPIPGITRQEP